MKFFDSLKISLHSISGNKIRTSITMLIVFVVSLLIMVISILVLSFNNSISQSYLDTYDTNGALFNLQTPYNSEEQGTDFSYKGISLAEYNIVMEAFEEAPELVDNVSINANADVNFLYDLSAAPTDAELSTMLASDQFYRSYGDSDLRFNVGLFSGWGDLDLASTGTSYLKEGRLWNKDDINKKNVWVSESFIANAALFGVTLQKNDSIVLTCVTFSKTAGESTRSAHADIFKIRGILLDDALISLNRRENVFIEVSTMMTLSSNTLTLNNVMVISEPKYGYDFDLEYKKMASVAKKVNDQIEPNVYNKRSEPRFRCDLVDTLKNVKLIGGLMIGAGIFIDLIILLISIGSVANSVMISVDKNKRFFGLLMAVGLPKKGVRKIVLLEEFIVIILATGIAYGVLYLVKNYFSTVLDVLIESTGMVTSSIITMPFYIPFAVIFGFILMAQLFARSTLSRVINMDVISVISEVA